MIIEPLARLNCLVKTHPFLASLLDAMHDLLTQVAAASAEFQNGEGHTLGHLEQDLQKPLGQFKARVMEKAAQRKADQAPPKCPECGRKLTRRQKLERTVQT